jgi:hypothetical protein
MHYAQGEVIEGPVADERTLGVALASGEWAIRLNPDIGAPLRFYSSARYVLGDELHVFPLHTIVAAPADATRLLRALEEVKPDELDADGRPLPWVPVRHRVEAVGGRPGDDEDAIAITDDAELPPIPPEPDAGAGAIERATVARWLGELSRTAGLAPPELTLARARENRLGFTTGRIFFDGSYVPRRLHLTLCPNSDAAEVLATLTHELAHAVARTKAHDVTFKRAHIALAARHFGAAWFAGAEEQVDRSYRIVDYWIASGIRAALRSGPADPARAPGDGEVPAPRVVDDGQLARVLGRIKKLRNLAADQLGRPEGIAATAAANDLVTSYGLESYGVQIDGEVHDQLVDRWVPLEDGAIWRRTLAHAVAQHCEVFSLAIPARARMHFFGRHADVIAAEYLYSVSAARIARECDAHLSCWRGGARRSSGDTRRERYSFCDSAAVAFQRKLEQLAFEEGLKDGAALLQAESFAEREHEKRGRSWGAGGRKTYRHNAAGTALGRSMEVLHGLEGGGRAPRGLPHR